MMVAMSCICIGFETEHYTTIRIEHTENHYGVSVLSIWSDSIQREHLSIDD